MKTMNVTDLRTSLRRSNENSKLEQQTEVDRRKRERREQVDELNGEDANAQRVWLTPGEKALIEDVYLLEEGE